MEVDLDETEDGYMSGTFRWKKSKKLPSMPAVREGLSEGLSGTPPLDVSRGWMEYFLSRGSTDEERVQLVTQAKSDMSIIDCLSTPLSIATLCLQAGIYRPDRPLSILHIVCVGASSKAEGRVLNETNCFKELSYIFSNIDDIQLYLVGPEMAASTPQARMIASNLHATEFRGTSKEFFRQSPHLLMGSSTVVVGVNCGFGNWENPLPVRFNLLMEWLPDLYFLTGTKIPLLFTCANDYADLSGEVAVMQHVMGSCFIVAPGRNPFSYASTLIPPGKDGKGGDNGSDYSCGNSFLYGVQSHDKSRRQKVAVGDVASLMRALQVPLLPIPSISSQLLPFGSLSSSKTSASVSDTVTAEHEQFAALLQQKAEAEKVQADRAAALQASAAAEKAAAAKLEAAQLEAKRLEAKQKEARDKIEAEAELERMLEKEKEREAIEKHRAAKKALAENTNRLEKKLKDSLNVVAPQEEKAITTKEMNKELIHTHCTICQTTVTPSDSLESVRLNVVIKFHVPVASLSDLEVDIENATRTLRLGIRVNGEVEIVDVPLLSHVLTETMKAKFSKKKVILTLEADMIFP